MRLGDIHFVVSWSDLIFFDGHICVKYEGLKYKIENKEARKIYNNIKLLYEKRLEPIKVKLSYQGAAIEDTILYDDVVRFLSIHTIFKETHELDLKTFHRINPKITHLLIPDNKSEYFDYLCKHQDGSHIIPVAEKYISRPDGFLFTIDSPSNNKYIIWESIKHGLATYVFETTNDAYYESISRIYDFISSKITFKRTNLRYRGSTKYIDEIGIPIEHKSFEDWKMQLINITQHE